MPDDHANWTMLVRPPLSQMPWEVVNIRAKSAARARAILFRNGYEVWEHSPGLERESDPIGEPHDWDAWEGFVEDAPLTCIRCRHPLDAAVIDRNAVVCHECGSKQRIFTIARFYLEEDRRTPMPTPPPVPKWFIALAALGVVAIVLYAIWWFMN